MTDASALLFALALVSNLAALAGLVLMILAYRRASKAVQEDAQKGRH